MQAITCQAHDDGDLRCAVGGYANDVPGLLRPCFPSRDPFGSSKEPKGSRRLTLCIETRMRMMSRKLALWSLRELSFTLR